MKFIANPFIGDQILPVEIVLSPEWWHANEGITFDEDFFFHPLKRVEEEQHMEKALYERWGNFGLGMLRKEKRPEIGPVHLASGFLISEMLGCRVEYYEDKAPEVIQAHREDLSLNASEAFHSIASKRYIRLRDELKKNTNFRTRGCTRLDHFKRLSVGRLARAWRARHAAVRLSWVIRPAMVATSY